MKKFTLIFLLTIGCLAHAADTEEVRLKISWSQDPKTEVYTNDQTGISFLKSIAGFEQIRATPANQDGSASFAYQSPHGIITVYLTHRLICGLPGSDDCTSEFRDTYFQMMRKAHGKTDAEELFGFSFARDGKKITGRGVTVHFVNSPMARGPVYSEFGAVLVGDFLYYYRASFPDKDGLKHLAAFLRAIGFERKST